MHARRVFWTVLGLLLATGPTLGAQEVGESVEMMGSDVEEGEMSVPVSRTFYSGSLNWYWWPGSGASMTSSGFAATARGGTISQVTACIFNRGASSLNFRATAAVRQAAQTLQSITFQRDFPSQRHTCHQLTGFNAIVFPGEFEVAVTYDKWDVENFAAALSATSNGQIFDVQIGNARPPYGTGSQGPIRMNGVGIGYRIAENDPPPPCAPDDSTLCFMNGRFEVKATYTDYGDNTGPGHAVALTPDSGYFWFFDAANVEAVGKVVSFCPLNGTFGFYAGGLTDVGVVMTVRDTVANQTQTFTNSRGHNFDMISSAFNTCQSAAAAEGPGSEPSSDQLSSSADELISPSEAAEISSLLRVAEAAASSGTDEDAIAPAVQNTATTQVNSHASLDPFDATGSEVGRTASTLACVPDATTLCLLGSRFEVRATYRDYSDNVGQGQAVGLTPDSGYFWFFDASNVEAVGKVVSFCPVNGSFGFYAGGLTDVEVFMTVRDTVANLTQTFTNARGHNFNMISSAFNTCAQ